jgi:hypothetical protein
VVQRGRLPWAVLPCTFGAKNRFPIAAHGLMVPAARAVQLLSAAWFISGSLKGSGWLAQGQRPGTLSGFRLGTLQGCGRPDT